MGLTFHQNDSRDDNERWLFPLRSGRNIPWQSNVRPLHGTISWALIFSISTVSYYIVYPVVPPKQTNFHFHQYHRI